MTRRFAGLLLILIGGCGAPIPDDEAQTRQEATSPATGGDAEATPVTAIPQRFRGVYDRSAAECASPGVFRLVVGERELRFHESVASLRRIEPDGENALSIAFDHQGEGENWSSVQRLELSDRGDRLTIMSGDAETVRVRCPGAPAEAELRWEHAASGEGDGLWLSASGLRTVTLFCPAAKNELLVNVPAFRPVGSEERMTFGSGGTVVTLVADPRGDSARGGVSGRGPVPDEIETILSGPAGVAVNYGAQNSGPHPAPPADLATVFVTGCRD